MVRPDDFEAILEVDDAARLLLATPAEQLRPKLKENRLAKSPPGFTLEEIEIIESKFK